MKKLLLIGLVLLPVQCFAQDVTVKDLCQRLETYQPSADVEYKPGQDAHGNAVAPADLDPQGQIVTSDTIRLAITYDQARQLNLPNVPYTPQMYIGDAEVKKDGSVYFNGKKLTQGQTQVLCDPKLNPQTNHQP